MAPVQTIALTCWYHLPQHAPSDPQAGILSVQAAQLKTKGVRASPTRALGLWNDLSEEVRSAVISF